MLPESAFDFVVTVVNILESINAEIGKDVIKKASAVAFAQNQSVTIRSQIVCRVIPEIMIVKCYSHIAQRQSSAKMSGIRTIASRNDILAYLQRFSFKFFANSVLSINNPFVKQK